MAISSARRESNGGVSVALELWSRSKRLPPSQARAERSTACVDAAETGPGEGSPRPPERGAPRQAKPLSVAGVRAHVAQLFKLVQDHP